LLRRSPKNDELIADRHQVLAEKMALMERRLEDGRTWLLGDEFSLADIALGPRTEMFPIIEMTDVYERFPRVGAFMERLRSRPSWALSDIKPDSLDDVTKVPA
jgi:glutathione S-transferase